MLAQRRQKVQEIQRAKPVAVKPNRSEPGRSNGSKFSFKQKFAHEIPAGENRGGVWSSGRS